MLQLFRSGLTSYLATALLVLLIASFALWGIGGDILGGAGNNVAQVGDQKITLNDYAREFQNKFTAIQQQSGGEVTREMAVDQGMARNWVSELVQNKAFAYAAHDLNIRVTDAELRKFITEIEAFQDTLGSFDKSKFELLAANRGYSASEFEELLRRDLERQYLLTSIASGISVPDNVEKTMVKYLTETRNAEIVTIPAFSITDLPEPDEKTLKKYYTDNSANYMAPEYRSFRFIILSIDDYIKGVTVTDAEIEQATGANAALSASGEKRDYDQILFDDKAGADKAFSDLQAGRSFADIIIATGLTSDDTAITGNSLQDSIDSYGAAAAEAIFTAEQDKYTAPVETDFGWRIFNISKISKTEDNSGERRKAAIDNLKKEKALDILYDKSELINDELAAGASLSDIAANLSLKVKVAQNIDRSGYDSAGNLVANIPADPAFLAMAFESLFGDEPQLEELGDGAYYLLVVDDIQESSLLPFAEVETSVRDIWTAETKKNLAREKAGELLEKAQEGVSMKSLAAAIKESSFNAVTLRRNDPAGKVSSDIQNAVFTLVPGNAMISPAADGNGFVVVRLLSRKLSGDSLPPAQSAQLKNLLTQEYQRRFLNSYWQYLESSLPVKINPRAVSAVHDQLTSRDQ